MDRKAAKELLHIRGWLDRVEEIVERGKDAYLARRDRPRSDLADAVAGPARMERIAPGTL